MKTGGLIIIVPVDRGNCWICWEVLRPRGWVVELPGEAMTFRHRTLEAPAILVEDWE